MNQSMVEGRITLGARGSASCSVSAFGYEVDVGASANACANGGLNGTYGDRGCNSSLTPVGGASFEIDVPAIEIGWFSIGGFNRKWETGNGC
jgi:hypothetical protein